MKTTNFETLFSPKSVAIIGASNIPGSLGKIVIDNLQWGNFQGKIYPVCDKPIQFANLKTYPSVSAIEAKIDLAVIIAESDSEKTFQQVCQAKIKTAVIMGQPQAPKTLEKIRNLAEEHECLVVGPESFGLINSHLSLNLSALGAIPNAGKTAIVSDGGPIGAVLLDLANLNFVSISKMISLGEKQIFDLELWQYLFNDDQTDSIIIYLENFNFGSEKINQIRQLTLKPNSKKPVFLYYNAPDFKFDDFAKTEAFCQQNGIVFCQNLDSLFDNLIAIQNNPSLSITKYDSFSNLPELANISKRYFPVAKFTNISRINPNKFDSLLKNSSDQAKIIILGPELNSNLLQIGELIIKFKKDHSSALVFVCLLGGESVREISSLFKRSGICVTNSIEKLASQIKNHQIFAKRQSYRDVIDIANAVTTDVKLPHLGDKIFDTEKSLELLNTYHLPISGSGLAKNIIDATKYSHQINGAFSLAAVAHDNIDKYIVAVVNNIIKDNLSENFELLVKNAKSQTDKKIDGIVVMPNTTADNIISIKAEKNNLFGFVFRVSYKEKTEFVFSPLSEKAVGELDLPESMKKYDFVHILGKVEQILAKNSEIKQVELNPIIISDKEMLIYGGRIMTI